MLHQIVVIFLCLSLTSFSQTSKFIEIEEALGQSNIHDAQKIISLLTLEKEFQTKYPKEIEALNKKILFNALKLQDSNEYAKASDLLYMAYQLQPSNLDFLYFAASNAISAKVYLKALSYYESLVELNYKGEGQKGSR